MNCTDNYSLRTSKSDREAHYSIWSNYGILYRDVSLFIDVA